MASPKLSIVLSDRNWVLERLGQELQARLERVDLNDHPDPSADINYYITFACRKRPLPTLEAAFFAHMEQSQELQSLFVETARQVHLPICMSSTYSDLLRANGIDKVLTIPPGVDHDNFQLKLRIGVVGRTYHTGRKGEALVAELMNMDGVDWHFTGTGWPKPGRHVSDEDLPDFYRSMDYILVPALYEGGPMCVPEALAVGTPVIASAVGWVLDFPHIPFRNGDAEDLRRVLTDLLAAKRKLRASTLSYNWDNYAEAHDRAFRDLMRENGRAPTPLQRRPALFSERVRLLTHGNEAISKGGPSVRVPKTAEALRAIGVRASASNFQGPGDITEDIVHVFNVWTPTSALSIVRQMKASGKRVVLSPIYLDLSERPFWSDQLLQLPLDNPAVLREAHAAAKLQFEGRGRLHEAQPGFHAMVREIFSLVDHVVFLSEVEREALAEIGAYVPDERASMVRNPVEAELWSDGDPSLFREAYLDGLPGPEEFILCVARIETRKNQLLLARAMRDMDLRLVLAGHIGDEHYAGLIRKEGGDRVLMAGRIEHGSEMHRSALAACSAFALPSWAEGASLSALEAAAMGCSIVLSNRSSEQEYFGDFASYCDPADPDSIRDAIERELSMKGDQTRRERLKALVAKHNGFEPYARATAKAYSRAAKSPPIAVPRPPVAHKPKLVFDVTTLAHHTGRITGISRVESQVATELLSRERDVTFITWANSRRQFVELPRDYVRFEDAVTFRLNAEDCHDASRVDLAEDCTIVVAGSAWMQNQAYVQGLELLKVRARCSLISIIYDLVPLKFPFWFQDNYAPTFVRNFERLAGISDHILTMSNSCAADVRDVLAQRGLDVPISTLRFGDPLLTVSGGTDLPVPNSPQSFLAGTKFVLAVGAIHTRKNYEMLYRVWARFADEKRHQDLHLVIVGGVAWNGKVLAESIARDKRVASRIHVLADIADPELGWLYQHCLFTVFPSHYEGWGLPVAESLVLGKLCLATSASSVPEIASDLVEHIDPEDFASWHQKISFYAGSSNAREAKERHIKSRYAPVAWSTTVDRLLDVVEQPRRIKGLRPLLQGEAVSASRDAAPLQFGYGGIWHLPESWGCWSGESNPQLRINLSTTVICEKPLMLVMRLNAIFENSNERKRLLVRCKGMTLFSTICTAKSFPRTVVLRVLPALIDRDGTVTLEFSFAASPETSNSRRQLGIGIQSITLLDPDYANPLHALEDSANWIDGTKVSHADFSMRAHREVLAPHLAYHPAWGVGPNNGMASFNIPILPGASAQDVEIHFRAVATPDNPISVVAYWNNNEKQRIAVTSQFPDAMRFRVEKRDLEGASPSILVIRVSSPISPAKAGIGVATEISGIGITDIIFQPKGDKN